MLILFLHDVFFCFCVMKPPAPEAQRLDDAIGFLRDHAEATVSFLLRFFFIMCFYVCCLLGNASIKIV